MNENAKMIFDIILTFIIIIMTCLTLLFLIIWLILLQINKKRRIYILKMFDINEMHRRRTKKI